MTTTTKTLLVISLLSFLFGFTNLLWGFGKPMGAICFGLFLIFKMLEKEVAQYDEEERRRRELAEHSPDRSASSVAPDRSHHEEGLTLAGHSAH